MSKKAREIVDKFENVKNDVVMPFDNYHFDNPLALDINVNMEDFVSSLCTLFQLDKENSLDADDKKAFEDVKNTLRASDEATSVHIAIQNALLDGLVNANGDLTSEYFKNAALYSELLNAISGENLQNSFKTAPANDKVEKFTKNDGDKLYNTCVALHTAEKDGINTSAIHSVKQSKFMRPYLTAAYKVEKTNLMTKEDKESLEKNISALEAKTKAELDNVTKEAAEKNKGVTEWKNGVISESIEAFNATHTKLKAKGSSYDALKKAMGNDHPELFDNLDTIIKNQPLTKNDLNDLNDLKACQKRIADAISPIQNYVTQKKKNGFWTSRFGLGKERIEAAEKVIDVLTQMSRSLSTVEQATKQAQATIESNNAAVEGIKNDSEKWAAKNDAFSKGKLTNFKSLSNELAKDTKKYDRMANITAAKKDGWEFVHKEKNSKEL